MLWKHFGSSRIRDGDISKGKCMVDMTSSELRVKSSELHRKTHNSQLTTHNSLTYRKAGVDVEGADVWLARMRPLIRSTTRSEVLADRGQFAGLFRLAKGRYHDPILGKNRDGSHLLSENKRQMPWLTKHDPIQNLNRGKA